MPEHENDSSPGARDGVFRELAFSWRYLAAPPVYCPFCEGEESKCPPPIAVVRSRDDGGWLARILPHRSPLLLPTPGVGVYGRHEVLVLGGDHVRLDEVSSDVLDAAFELLKVRFLEYMRDPRCAGAGALFGLRSDAPSHPLAVLYASEWLASCELRRFRAARAFAGWSGRCLGCTVASPGASVMGLAPVEPLVLFRGEATLVYVPSAPWRPFHVRQLSRFHVGEATESSVDGFFSECRLVLSRVLEAWRSVLGASPCSSIVFSCPFHRGIAMEGEGMVDTFDMHWCVEYVPGPYPVWSRLAPEVCGLWWFESPLPPRVCHELMRDSSFADLSGPPPDSSAVPPGGDGMCVSPWTTVMGGVDVPESERFEADGEDGLARMLEPVAAAARCGGGSGSLVCAHGRIEAGRADGLHAVVERLELPFAPVISWDVSRWFRSVLRGFEGAVPCGIIKDETGAVFRFPGARFSVFESAGEAAAARVIGGFLAEAAEKAGKSVSFCVVPLEAAIAEAGGGTKGILAAWESDEGIFRRGGLPFVFESVRADKEGVG